jgi:hypothetical protein
VTIGNSSITSNKLFGRVIHADAVNADESATLGQVNTSLGGYVTLNTAQTITAQKVFTTSGSSDSVIITHGSGSGFALDVIKAGNGEVVRVNKTSGSGNAMTVIGGDFEAPTIVKTGGTSSQFLKADGSVDSSTYLTTGTAASTYITIATPTTITGVKTFASLTLNLAAAGSSNATIFSNSSADQTSMAGVNFFGFNSNNNIYFNKGTTLNAGFLVFNNTAARTYTLPDATGTIALTSNLGAYLPLTGGTLTGALNGTSATFAGGITLTGAQTIQTSTGNLTLATAGGNGDILLSPNGTGGVGIGTTSPLSKVEIRESSPGNNLNVLRLTNPGTTTGTGASIILTTLTSNGVIASSSIGSLAENTSGNSSLIFRTPSAGSGSEKVRITSDGYQRMASGTGGIQFNGDTAAANALDDYEEGTWTAVIRGSGTAGTYEIDTQFSTYTKIGRLVTANCRIDLDSSITGGGTGYVQITGLPFSKGSGRVAFGTTHLVNVDFTGTYVTVAFISPSATSTLYLVETVDNGSEIELPVSSISAGDRITFSITYEV